MGDQFRRQTYVAKPGEYQPRWFHVDATDKPLGRLAVDVATILMGKHRPEYTPHTLSGDYVIITNGQKVGLTGRKAEQRVKLRYTRHTGGLKAETYGSVRERRPEKLLEDAVRRMLPKNRLGRAMIKQLKVYPGAEHPHQAQQPAPFPF
ncbi:MAG: 50S ribosomal protein L13 [Phycisphaeraceae bacterium]|nr:50S ribosomal protein L13 [Phycisphaeraceae bacterium]MCW5755409.1 50S ribosomal protein L13 [Phycisphaeraceae bacterium]